LQPKSENSSFYGLITTSSLLKVFNDKENLLAELKKRLKISIFLWRKSCASR
jgi:hypothetical protein